MSNSLECEFVRGKRCPECIRPICQRKLIINNNTWVQDVSSPLINEYKLHDLFVG